MILKYQQTYINYFNLKKKPLNQIMGKEQNLNKKKINKRNHKYDIRVFLIKRKNKKKTDRKYE